MAHEGDGSDTVIAIALPMSLLEHTRLDLRFTEERAAVALSLEKSRGVGLDNLAVRRGAFQQ